jgi:probable phosphoglycerate mutase
LTRHGETIWHAQNRYAGITDIDLTERGHEQALALANWAASAKLCAIWVSPMKRARQTAVPVVKSTGLAPNVDERLREIDFGRGEGLTASEMRERFGDAFDAFVADPVANQLPGGESPVDAAHRAVNCLRDIAARHAGGRVLIISHNTLTRLALCQMLEIPLSKYRTVFPSLANVALSEIGIQGNKTSLFSLNRMLQNGGDSSGDFNLLTSKPDR